MKVVGGKEIPGGRGEIGAYVARIYPGGVVETLGEVREGERNSLFHWISEHSLRPHLRSCSSFPISVMPIFKVRYIKNIELKDAIFLQCIL